MKRSMLGLSLILLLGGCSESIAPVEPGLPAAERSQVKPALAGNLIEVFRDEHLSISVNPDTPLVQALGDEPDYSHLVERFFGDSSESESTARCDFMPEPAGRSLKGCILVFVNCLITQLAAEAFASQNNGVYPGSTASPLPDGDTLIDLLPGGSFLMNPRSGCMDSPVDGWPGHAQVGYFGVYPERNGYTIRGAGFNGDIICTITRRPS